MTQRRRGAKEGKGDSIGRRGAKRERVLLGAKTQGGKLRGRVGKVKSRPFALTAGAAPVWLWRVRVGVGELANADGRLCVGLFALR